MQAMPFTGERYVPEIDGEIRLEHIHRYAWARELVVGLDVLDIASGEGFGAALLSEKAKSVVGVDISEDAVAHAQTRYAEFASFLVGSANNIPLEDGSVDAVVSFETIEHVHNHDLMLQEIKRVLKPSGFLIISSPDKEIYSEKPGYVNEFHVSELTLSEFKSLISKYFSNVQFFGQKISACSAIVNYSTDEMGSGGVFYTDQRNGDVVPGLTDAADCKYVISVASECSEFFPTALNSALFSQKANILAELARARAQAASIVMEDEIIGKYYSSEPVLRIMVSRMFDDEYYSTKYDLKRMTRLELARHYLTHGEKEGFLPSENFDPNAYLSANPDVEGYALGPLCHYIDHGAGEGRRLS